jgi:hypothetical protein
MASKGLAALQECSGEGKGVYFEGQYIGNVIEEASLIRNEYKHVIQKIHLTPETAKEWGTEHGIRFGYYKVAAKGGRIVWGNRPSTMLEEDAQKLNDLAVKKGIITQAKRAAA